MNIEDFRNLCLRLPFIKENQPWNDNKYDMLVTYSLATKWVCLLNLDSRIVNIKCAPDRVLELLDLYEGAIPAVHMNKKHWIGIRLDSDLPDEVIETVLNDGYELIYRSLPKKIRLEFDSSKSAENTL